MKKKTETDWDKIIEECRIKDKERLLMKCEILEDLIIQAMKNGSRE